MTIIRNKRDLKYQTDNFVFVQEQQMIYQKYDDTYIARVYLRVEDLMNIFQADRLCIRSTLFDIGVNLPENRFERLDMNAKQLHRLIEVCTQNINS